MRLQTIEGDTQFFAPLHLQQVRSAICFVFRILQLLTILSNLMAVLQILLK